jgi:hypothetical protein
MLRCAYLPSRDPTVLLWGNEDNLRRLGALLSDRAASPAVELISDEQSPDRVFLTFDDAPHGMKVEGDMLVWQIAPSDGTRFAALIGAMILHTGPCHQYLDCANGSGVEVKVSLGEYPEGFRP